MKKLTSRILARYIPAIGTLFLSKLIIDNYTDETYATFAIAVSFSSLLTVLDIGGSTIAVLTNGAKHEVARLSKLPAAISLLILIIYIMTRVDIILIIFLISTLIPIYIVAKGSYSISGADAFNKRALYLYPFAFFVVAFLVFFHAPGAPLYAAIFVVFFVQIFGARLKYVKDVMKSAVCNLQWSDFIPKRNQLYLTLLSAIAFVGAWGNLLYLSTFGTSYDVKQYDLIWRFLTITFFAQIYLTHSLPEVVNAANSRSGYKAVLLLKKMAFLSVALSSFQVFVALVFFPVYAMYFGFEYEWHEVWAGLAMCVIFGLLIPINQFLMTMNRLVTLIFLFGLSAVLSALAKFIFLPDVVGSFLSTAAGYSFALIFGTAIIIRALISTSRRIAH